jgi:hypothetical protein
VTLRLGTEKQLAPFCGADLLGFLFIEESNFVRPSFRASVAKGDPASTEEKGDDGSADQGGLKDGLPIVVGVFCAVGKA